jgi:putative ATPase
VSDAPVTRNFFAEEEVEPATVESAKNENAPLAERMRPRTLDEVVGQEHLVGGDGFLRRLLTAKGRLPSLILWGAPGTGKTTMARVLAGAFDLRFVQLSAVFSGVKELRAELAAAEKMRSRRTLLFIDEIHRFNKAQQDALLPSVETGAVTFVGATTENPSFEVTNALRSRCRVLTLKQLAETEILCFFIARLRTANADSPTLSRKSPTMRSRASRTFPAAMPASRSPRSKSPSTRLRPTTQGRASSPTTQSPKP